MVRQGIVHVPEGREIFPLLTVTDNLTMGAYARTDRANIERDIEMVYGYFPILRERRRLAGRLPVGRPAADAGDRAGVDGAAPPHAAGRAVPGAAPILVKEIFAIMRRLRDEQNVTMLLVEQNANMALEAAHYGYVLELGRIVLEGACSKLIQNEDVREFYLGQKETTVRGKKRWKRTKRWR